MRFTSIKINYMQQTLRLGLTGLFSLGLLFGFSRPAAADVETSRQQYQNSLSEVKVSRQNYIDTRRKNPENGDARTLTLITTEGQNYLLKSINAMTSYVGFIRTYVESLPDLPESTRQGAFNLIDSNLTWYVERKQSIASLTGLQMARLESEAKEINTQWRLTTRHTHQVLASILIYRMETRVQKLSELVAQIEQKYETEKDTLSELSRTYLDRTLAKLNREITGINENIALAKESFTEKAEADDLDKEAFDSTFDHLRNVEEDLSTSLTRVKSIVQSPTDDTN